MTLEQAFGAAVKLRRLEAKLSQEELAEKADMLGSALGRLERGAVSTSLETVGRVAAALNTKPWALLWFAGQIQTGVRLEALEPPPHIAGD
ncbi:helix-turn-helix transcriptional regulator [Cupriavidus sp. P-10]|uniref:helix-turn-helix domain-containing protein n=1 Tax=Cupriavidus sp. P-10 TaxID=2027911 RepID=UPI000E2FE80E|nr:helix-turn-helix transcriptional regulator [Cupriavidus sp. P-10]BDB27878.1 helix-turn-helix transcriptional regulator [Cupriavidus sp. P-10]